MRNTNRKICKIFSKNLSYYMYLHGLDRRGLANETKIKYSTICNWLNCYSYASEDKIEQLAEYFKISKYQLTENDDNQHTTINSTLKVRKEIIDIISQLSDEELEPYLHLLRRDLENKLKK